MGDFEGGKGFGSKGCNERISVVFVLRIPPLLSICHKQGGVFLIIDLNIVQKYPIFSAPAAG